MKCWAVVVLVTLMLALPLVLSCSPSSSKESVGEPVTLQSIDIHIQSLEQAVGAIAGNQSNQIAEYKDIKAELASIRIELQAIREKLK